MEKTKTPVKAYLAELRQPALRMVCEQVGCTSQRAAIRPDADKVDCRSETLRLRVRQAERDRGERAGPSSGERARQKALERKARERRQATRSRARRARILRRRGSTASPRHDRLH